MTNKPNQHLDLPKTGAATPTSSSLKTSLKPPTQPPPKTPENPLLAAISEVTIPVLAQTFKLTPAAISSWVANKHVPWGHLARLSDLTTIPLPELLDANSQSPKQEFRGAKRPLALLEDLAKLPSPTEDDLQTLAHTHNIELRILKVMVKTTPSFKLEYDTLTHLNQQFPDKQTQRAALDEAAKTLKVGVHEVNRRLRRWGIAPPPLASVAARKERQGRRAANQQRLAIAVRHYIRGASIEEAAIAGQTSTHYLYRIARTVFESFGETLRNLRGFPTYIRYALAEDAQHTLQGGTSYAAPLLALYRKTPQTKPRRYAATLKDGFVDLLPGAIASQFTIDEIAEAKETSATVITQRFTDLLLPIGLTWHAIEQMSDYHRDAFYQLLLMKPPE